MSEITWTVTERGGHTHVVVSEKLPHITAITITKDMDKNQKEFFTKYNQMQQKLIEHGLMETK